MDYLIAANSVPLASRDTAPTAGTPQWATDGDPTSGVAATDFPAYIFNAILSEITTAIIAGGLTLDGSDWTQLSQVLKLNAKGRLVGVAVFPESDVYTAPTADTSAMFRVRAVGAGGGGCNTAAYAAYYAAAGGGGQAGSYAEVWLTWAQLFGSTAVSTASITIGAGGGSSITGGTTFVGGAVVCPGGIAAAGASSGNYSTLNPGGNGASECTFPNGSTEIVANFSGDGGGYGIIMSPQSGGNYFGFSGSGGNSQFGQGGVAAGAAKAGLAGGAGAGGSGACSGVVSSGYTPVLAGGDGGDGHVVIECFIGW